MVLPRWIWTTTSPMGLTAVIGQDLPDPGDHGIRYMFKPESSRRGDR